jgi:hypothetical protein
VLLRVTVRSQVVTTSVQVKIKESILPNQQRILIQESIAGHRLTDATNFSIMTGTNRSAARQDASKFVGARSSLTTC